MGGRGRFQPRTGWGGGILNGPGYRWVAAPEPEVPPDLKEFVGGHPLVAKTLVRRQIQSRDQACGFLDPSCYRPASPYELTGMETAVQRLEQALARDERICIWGDFDVDGQTSTSLLVETLRGLGARVRFHIPDRAKESHGIRLPVLKSVLESGVDLLVTCDTGIGEHESIAYAQGQGVDVIITDHHTLPETLPDALAVVNPQLLLPEHPLADLPGVGVAYKLAEALLERAGKPEAAEALLDLVALGIVADVAQQVGDTRYLLQRGLQVLRETPRLGLQSLFEYAVSHPAGLTEQQIGFAIAPRMNALGRLSNANPIVDFLTTEDRSQARVLANRLEGLNDERRLLTNQVYQAAAAQLERDPGLGEMDALVLAHPGWPGGILGLVASRLVEHYQRPVVMLSIGEDGIARGSARSVQGCNITEAIAAQADLLLGFGGHPMAAGLSLPESQVPDFRHRFAAVVADMLAGQDAVQELVVDAVLELPEVSLKLVDDLSRLAPFGAGNPSLTFVSRGLTIRQQQVIGRDQEHRRLVVADEKENIQEVLWWRSAAESLPAGPFDLAYTLQAADFRGERQLQITWVDARPTEGSTAEIRSEKPLQIIDYRSAAHPLAVLDTITDAPRMIWAEAGAAVPEAADRYHLSPAPVLVIWTVPPGDQALRRALETVQPEKVFLLGEDPPYAARRAFLKRLGQLVNYALRVYAGKLEIPRLAAATGHREAVVRVGLNWLAGRGHIKLDWESSSVARAGPGDGEEAAPLGTLSADLERLLAETRAFRSFYLQSDPERLLSSG